jgi:carboxymethylenebutenolidase
MKTLVIQIICIGLAALLSISCNSEKKEYVDRLSMEHEGDEPVENKAAKLGESSTAEGKMVSYATVSGREVSGYLAQPTGAEIGNPAIIVIHEWWGLNDNIRMMADKLAGDGYTALAVDLYYGKVAESPDSAGTYARSVNEKEAIDNLSQAYKYLSNKQDAGKVGVIGWCFGGGWSLQTALAHPDELDAAVIYYGRLVTDPGQLEKLQMPVLGIFGGKDQSIPPKTVKQFEAALNEAGVNNSIYIYDGAGHAFANPSGTRYVKEAAEDAWQKTTSFLEEHLK